MTRRRQNKVGSATCGKSFAARGCRASAPLSRRQRRAISSVGDQREGNPSGGESRWGKGDTNFSTATSPVALEPPSPGLAQPPARGNQQRSLRTRKTELDTYQLHQQAVGDLGVVFLNLLLDLLDGRRFGFFFLYCWCYILESEGSGFSWVRGRRSAPLSLGNRGDEGAAQTLSSHQQRRHRRRRSRG